MKLLGNFLNFNKFSVEKKRIVANIFSLSSLEFANYVMPLITLPYLVRVLGPSKYGLIAFAQAIIQYFVIVADYGFNLTATKDISVHRSDLRKIESIFNSVMLIKVVLSCVGFFLMILLVFLIPQLRTEYIIFIGSYGIVFGVSLFPTWFFQGMERMKFIAVINLIAKMLFTASIFLLIKSDIDYIYVPLITSIGFIFAGVLGIWISCQKFHIKLRAPSMNDVILQLKRGWHVFTSRISVGISSNSSILILGIFTDNTIVGYYSAADKLIKAICRFLNIISQSIYPYMSRRAVDSHADSIRIAGKLATIYAIFFSIIGICLFLAAPEIVALVFGAQYGPSIIVLRILSILPLLFAFSNVIGMQILLPFGKENFFAIILAIGAVINIVLSVLTVAKLQIIGVCLSSIISELVVIVAMFLYVRCNILNSACIRR